MKTFEVLATGVEATIQDRGRRGWKRFGIPPSGFMDSHAAAWANRLLDNSADAAMVELLYGGAQFLALSDVWIAVTGADQSSNVPRWRATRVTGGQRISFPAHGSGMWTYLAVEGGFAAPKFFGSASVYRRGAIGSQLRAGDTLERCSGALELPPGVAGRMVPPGERRNYERQPTIRVWPGPQWELFDSRSRQLFFQNQWTVSSQSDRIGYRLAGSAIKAPARLLSEPVLVGSIQIPENGQPIVTMRDGPTVGGYPKLGLVHQEDLPWLCQCAPGQTVMFAPVA